MNIKITKGVQDSYKLHSNSNINNAPTKFEDGESLATKSKSDNMNVDKINISSKGSFQTKLNTEIKKYAIAAQANSSPTKISELKLKYNNNNCPVSGSDIAQKMMQNICGIKNFD